MKKVLKIMLFATLPVWFFPYAVFSVVRLIWEDFSIDFDASFSDHKKTDLPNGSSGSEMPPVKMPRKRTSKRGGAR